MTTERPKADFQIKYFEVSDSQADPQNSAPDDEAVVYVQVETTMTKKDVNEILGTDEQAVITNDGKNLMLFNDQSGSMSGTPFETLKKACLDLGEEIFGEDKASNTFETVDTVFFESYTHLQATNTKAEYMQHIQESRVCGGTNFFPCFDTIKQTVTQKARQGSEFVIIFFTDGQGSWSDAAIDELNALFMGLQQSKQVTVTIYCIGFSAGHDAKLLNRLATCGSQMGNFVYIDTSQANYPEQIKEALSGSLNLALGSSGKTRISLENAALNFKSAEVCKMDKSYEELKESDEVQIDSGEGESNWISARYYTHFILKEKELMSGPIQVALQLSKDKHVDGNAVITKVEDVPIVLRKQAEIEMVNRQTFDLIQKIQSRDEKVDKQQAFEQLKAIDRSLTAKYEECMLIKERATKKRLMEALMECRKRTSGVISELRGVTNFSNISNQIIAKMNDLAFKAVNNASLQKMIDKRAVANEQLYEKLEKEAIDITSKMDFKKLEEEHKEIIASIGNCPLSVVNTIEALEEQDCMCIGLEVVRPEAAIADASRLVIKDIFPTYMTAESFLQSAQFKISNSGGDGSQAHGGFDNKNKGALAMGLGREDITGVLPLFLFKEHWSIAKRKVQPIFGFMCTLDIMGFTFEQYVTIPFLVLMKASAKLIENPDSEVNQRVFNQIEQTCIQIIQTAPTYKQNLVESIVKFAFPPSKTSTRTVDVIKSIGVFSTQFQCLLKTTNLLENLQEHQEPFFKDEAKLKQLKENFIKYATEEQLRRNSKDMNELVNNASKLEATLYADNDAFFERVYGAKEEQIRAQHTKENESQEDAFAAYAQAAADLKSTLGYDEEEAKKEEKSDEKGANKDEEIVKQIDFDTEVKEIVNTSPWNQSDKVTELLSSLQKKFNQYNKFLFRSFSSIDGNKQYENVKQALGTESNAIILAMSFQNGRQDKNSRRVEAVESGTDYIDFLAAQEQVATDFIKEILENQMLNRLRQAEKALLKGYEAAAGNDLAIKILKAPDRFYAAAIMKSQAMLMGTGDFQKIIDVLQQGYDPEFKDIGNKLALVCQGELYGKGVTKGIDAPDGDGLVVTPLPEGQKKGRVVLFADSKRPHGSVNYKHVFQIWAKHVYLHPESGLTTLQLINLFPELKDRLNLYEQCMNERGQIVKNHDFYKAYKKTDHKSGKRGGQALYQNKEQRKQKREAGMKL